MGVFFMTKNHYVYYSYEEWGRGYIGVRSTKLDLYEDKYMGSFKNKSFKPTQKIVLQVFNTREEALNAEITLHNFYQVHTNPHFANKAKQTSAGFNQESVKGRVWWNDGKKRKLCQECPGPEYRLGKFLPGEKNPMFGKTHSEVAKKKLSEFRKTCTGGKASMFGKSHSEVAKKKISEFRSTCTGDKNPMYGRRGENSPIFGTIRNEETRKKMSEHAKSCRWWNNGTDLKRSPNSPGSEWKLGWIKRKV
jgi:hypothetical protein